MFTLDAHLGVSGELIIRYKSYRKQFMSVSVDVKKETGKCCSGKSLIGM